MNISCIRYVILSLVLLVTGCTTVESTLEKRVETFEKTVFQYENALRWSHYEKAIEFIIKDTSGPGPDLSYLKDIKISSDEVLKSTISSDQLHAEQLVRIDYYNINNLLEKSLTRTQKWIYDTNLHRWLMMGPLPLLK